MACSIRRYPSPAPEAALTLPRKQQEQEEEDSVASVPPRRWTSPLLVQLLIRADHDDLEQYKIQRKEDREEIQDIHDGN
eukprot:COSAG06_NODE_38976_length_417_cov_1.465409_1_plen_78_part_01